MENIIGLRVAILNKKADDDEEEEEERRTEYEGLLALNTRN